MTRNDVVMAVVKQMARGYSNLRKRASVPPQNLAKVASAVWQKGIYRAMCDLYPHLSEKQALDLSLCLLKRAKLNKR